MGSLLMVYQATPPQPSSKARRTWYSELLGGPEATQNGFGAFTPQKSMLKSGWVAMGSLSILETAD